MRTVPLAAVLFLASASAATENCIVPMTKWQDRRPLAFDAASPACLVASDLLADFAKLSAAASFSTNELSLSVDPSTEIGAHYKDKGVWFTVGRLNDTSFSKEANLATLAHEIGHAVQYRDGQGAWSNAPFHAYFKRVQDKNLEKFKISPEGKEEAERKRKLEAHADAIAQELLLRAGFPPDLFSKGRANSLGCTKLADRSVPPIRHPNSAQIHVNAAMTSGALANERARKAALALSSALDETASSEFEAVPFAPTARITDYDVNGRLHPGRRAAESLRVAPPPPDAGPVREHTTLISMAAVDFWIADPFQAAVDRLASQNRVVAQVLMACGKPEVSQFDEDFNVFGWMKRIAADAALRAVGKTLTSEKTVRLEIPG